MNFFKRKQSKQSISGHPIDSLANIPDADRLNERYYPEPSKYYEDLYVETVESKKRMEGMLNATDHAVLTTRRIRCVDAILTKGKVSSEFIKFALKHSNPDIREDIAYILSKFGKAENWDSLLEVYHAENDAVVKMVVIKALVKSNKERALTILEEVIQETMDQEIQWECAKLYLKARRKKYSKDDNVIVQAINLINQK